MAIDLLAADPFSPEAQALFSELTAELEAEYPGHPLNDVDMAEFERAGGYLVLAKDGEDVLGCGGFRPIEFECAEIKRVYVRPDGHRKGIARQILRHLEDRIRERGFQTVVIETAVRQEVAIAFYRSEGYFPIPRFLAYADEPLSQCFAKPVAKP